MILHKVGFRSFMKSSQLRCSNKIKDLLDNAAIGEKSDKLDMTPEEAANKWSTSPYPEGAVINDSYRDQSRKAKRDKRDPRETSIVLFPGQGSQYVGMGRNLLKIPEARDMYAIAKEVLG